MTRKRLQKIALIIAGAGLALCALGALADWFAFLRAWLVAVITWLAVPLGALPVLMAHNLTGGGWGEAGRGHLKATIATLPLFLLAFVPLLLGIKYLFVWATPVEPVQDMLEARHFYLDLPFFYFRLPGYFLLWLWLALRLHVWGGGGEVERPVVASAVGLLIWALTTTFFSIDWLMSLEPLWYSDIFGLLWMSSVLVTTLSMLMLAETAAQPHPPEPQRSHRQDLANIWLGTILTWVFLGFSQYLIIWNADLPREISWYLNRLQGGWQVVLGAVMLLYFALPFIALLFRAVKRSGGLLFYLAAAVFIGHWLETLWLIAPTFSPGRFRLHWLQPIAALTLGALWLLWYLRFSPAPQTASPAQGADTQHGQSGPPRHREEKRGAGKEKNQEYRHV